MASLQYVIDSICASVTAESVYALIKAWLRQREFAVDEILPIIQSKDRSLDSASARMIAEAALGELAQRGELRIEGDSIFPA
jgi:hypothetical protein